jgi:hypothetical protein
LVGVYLLRSADPDPDPDIDLVLRLEMARRSDLNARQRVDHRLFDGIADRGQHAPIGKRPVPYLIGVEDPLKSALIRDGKAHCNSPGS